MNSQISARGDTSELEPIWREKPSTKKLKIKFLKLFFVSSATSGDGWKNIPLISTRKTSLQLVVVPGGGGFSAPTADEDEKLVILHDKFFVLCLNFEAREDKKRHKISTTVFLVCEEL